MSTITTRSGKGSALTHTEMDNNFTNLNTDKVETKGTLTKTFANNETAAITLSSAMPSGHIPVVSVTKDATVDGLVESSWDVNSTGSNYETGDGTTYTVTLTSANAGHTPYNLQWDGVTANTAGELSTILSDGAGGLTGPSPGYSQYLKIFKFIDSGNKIFIANTGMSGFALYDLSTPYDPSTAVLANTSSINWTSGVTYNGSNWMYHRNDIEFDDDGDRMWLIGSHRQYTGSSYTYWPMVQEFTLSTPFVIEGSNLTHSGNNVAGQLFGTSAGYQGLRGWYKDSGLYMQDQYYLHRLFDNDNTTSVVGVSNTNNNGYSIIRDAYYTDPNGGIGAYTSQRQWVGPMSDDLQRVVGKDYYYRDVFFFEYTDRQGIRIHSAECLGDYDPLQDLSSVGPRGQWLEQEPFRQWYADNGGTFSTSTLFNTDYYNMLDADPDGKLYFFYPKVGRVYSMTGAHVSKARFKRSSGSWSASDVGKVIVGNGGKAVLTAIDGSYEIIDPFDNTDPITSWTLEDFSVKSDAEGFELASSSSKYDLSRAHINPDNILTNYGSVPDDRQGMSFDAIDFYPVSGTNANNMVNYQDTTFENGVFSIENGIRAVCWGDNGNIAVFYGSYNNKFYTVDLNRPYDFLYNTPVVSSTKIYDPSSATDCYDIEFSANGHMFFYTLGATLVSVELTTDWDIGSANTSTKYTTTALYSGSSAIMHFNIKPDGTKLWCMDYFTNGNQKNILEYTLTTPWDLSTRTLAATHTTPAKLFEGIRGNGTATGEEYTDHYYTRGMFEWNSDGTALFVQRYNRETSQFHRSYLAKFGAKTAYDVSTLYVTGHMMAGTQGDSGVTSSWYVGPRSMMGGDGTMMIHATTSSSPVYYYLCAQKTGGKSYLTGYHTAITGSTAQIDTTNWNDINSVTVTEAKGDGDIYYSFSTDNRTTWKIIHNTDGERSIARNNGGTWQYNSNITYATTTWSNAAINSEKGAIEEAISLSVNRMDKTQFEAVSDANHITMGSTLDLAITYNLTSSGLTSPTSDGVSLNYAGSSGDQGAVIGTDYNWVLANTTTVEVTALAPANLKVRIV